jgi:hypothetical protein
MKMDRSILPHLQNDRSLPERVIDGTDRKKESAMRDMQGQINEWISRNRQNLIRCPHQPGNLLITKWSCRTRRLKAQKADLANVMSGDVMDYVHRQGLSICLNCNAMRKAKAA